MTQDELEAGRWWLESYIDTSSYCGCAICRAYKFLAAYQARLEAEAYFGTVAPAANVDIARDAETAAWRALTGAKEATDADAT